MKVIFLPEFCDFVLKIKYYVAVSYVYTYKNNPILVFYIFGQFNALSDEYAKPRANEICKN